MPWHTVGKHKTLLMTILGTEYSRGILPVLVVKLKANFFFKVHGSVRRKNIVIYVQQYATLHSLFYLESALHVSGGPSTHHQERS